MPARELTPSQKEVQDLVRGRGLCGAVDDPPTVTCLRDANHRGCHGEYPGFLDPDEGGDDS